MKSPRFAPAGLVVRCGTRRIAIDGGPGADPRGSVDTWLVTDEHAELRAALRRLARNHGVTNPAISEYAADSLHVQTAPSSTPRTRPAAT